VSRDGVVDLSKLETSFTDSTASHADTGSPTHPTTTLMYESECPTIVAAGRHRPSVDAASRLPEPLLAANLAELRGKPTDSPMLPLAGVRQHAVLTSRVI